MIQPLASLPEKKFLSIDEVGPFLQAYAGFSPKRCSLYNLTSRGKIPFSKSPTGRLLFAVEKIKAWAESGDVEKVED